jgi:hypothetical protein
MILPYGDTLLAVLTSKYQEIGCRVPDLQLLFYFVLFIHISEKLHHSFPNTCSISLLHRFATTKVQLCALFADGDNRPASNTSSISVSVKIF